jgi:hypothetical protein
LEVTAVFTNAVFELLCWSKLAVKTWKLSNIKPGRNMNRFIESWAFLQA